MTAGCANELLRESGLPASGRRVGQDGDAGLINKRFPHLIEFGGAALKPGEAGGAEERFGPARQI